MNSTIYSQIQTRYEVSLSLHSGMGEGILLPEVKAGNRT